MKAVSVLQITKKSAVVSAMVIALGGLSASYSQAQDQATFERLGYLSEKANPKGSVAAGITADGTKVVGSSFIYDGNLQKTDRHGIMWTSGGGLVDLGIPLNGLEGSIANAVSDDGDVVAGANGFWMDWYFEIRNGMYWTGVMGGNPDKYVFEEAMSMNDVTADGSMIIGATRLPGPWPVIDSAFYYTEGGGFVKLGYLSDGTYSWGEACSADGSVIVGYGDGLGSIKAVMWTEDNGLTMLPGQAEEYYSQALGISADGSTIVGAYGLLDEEAFYWNADEQFVIIGRLKGYRKAYGVDASADGSVIVGYNWQDTDVEEAFIWNAADGMRSVYDVLTTDYDLDLTGWTLQRATAISDDGTTFCGYGVTPEGHTEGWVAHLPTGGSTVNLTYDVQVCPDGGAGGVSWTNGTANGKVGLVLARNQGKVTIPFGPCKGVQLGLGALGIQLVTTARSDAAGSGNIKGKIPAAACGAFLQLVDIGSCRVSNVVVIE